MSVNPARHGADPPLHQLRRLVHHHPLRRHGHRVQRQDPIPAQLAAGPEQNLTGGISYLYTKVIDKAGNQAIDGHIIISYQWYGRKYNSTTWETISGATNANYDIPKTVTNFSSLYRYYSCVVTSTIDGQTTNKRSNEAELTYAASV